MDARDMIDQLMKAGEQRKRAKGENFIKICREGWLEHSEDEISKLYSRDKGDATFKLCKMKSGKFAIIDNVSSENLFSCFNLHEAKCEFILMQSMSTEMGANIFDKASGF